MKRTFAHAVLLALLSAALVAPPEVSVDARSGYSRAAWRHHHRRSLQRQASRNVDRTQVSLLTPAPDAQLAPPARPQKLLTRDEILSTDPTRLERLGGRLVVGFESFADVKPLVEKKAIAGIFITDHNVYGRKAADVAKDIDDLQNIRRAQGLPRLIVAADQEGGYVSRLSPPLKWQPTLGTIIEKLRTDEEREKAVREYAEAQAHELERLGITMNFGPVVDLRLGSSTRDDGETRTFWRAIDKDP